MNDEGSLIDLTRFCAVKEALNPAFFWSCSAHHKDGRVCVTFGFWVFNKEGGQGDRMDNNQPNTPTPPNNNNQKKPSPNP